MYRFYIGQDQIQEDEIHILDSDVNHIRNVLRLEPGDWLVACDGEGTDYVCRIQSLSPDDVTLSIEKKQESGTELDTRITLFQGIPKKDKMEFIIQKAVELGVARHDETLRGKAFRGQKDQKEDRALAGDRGGGGKTVRPRHYSGGS